MDGGNANDTGLGEFHEKRPALAVASPNGPRPPDTSASQVVLAVFGSSDTPAG